MFDIGFSELLLVFVIGLIVLGPQRLPVAVKTVVGWIRAMRSLAANVQNELAQELKLQELQDSLKKVEEAGKGTLSPELKESMEELRKTADSMKRTYREATDMEGYDDKAHGGNAGQPSAGSEKTTPPPVTPSVTEPPQHPTASSAGSDTPADTRTASSVKAEPESATKPASSVSEER